MARLFLENSDCVFHLRVEHDASRLTQPPKTCRSAQPTKNTTAPAISHGSTRRRHTLLTRASGGLRLLGMRLEGLQRGRRAICAFGRSGGAGALWQDITHGFDSIIARNRSRARDSRWRNASGLIPTTFAASVGSKPSAATSASASRSLRASF